MARPPASEWGDVKVGQFVTNQGRHGVGQPVVAGKLVAIESNGTGVIQPNDGSDQRRRSLRNLRRF